MGLAIPLNRGEFLRPSIVYYKDKKRVLSQDLIDTIVDSIQTNKPSVKNEFTTRVEFHRMENIERTLFGAPDDPTGWSLLTTERY